MSTVQQVSDVQAVEIKPTRHVLGLSGGKDSAALAIYLKNQGRDEHIEYFFCDTGAELPEVYDYLDRLEDYLGKPIERLSSGRDFDHHLKRFNGFLPAPHARWCTRVMKIEPLEAFIGHDPCVSYVAIRADESRQGYISHKPNIKAEYPFIDDGVIRDDVIRILEDTVGIPEYYRWRSRSGCYFCFFQRKDEWIGLATHHPDHFAAAKKYEKVDAATGKRFTWIKGMTLDEVVRLQEASPTRSRTSGKTSWQERLNSSDHDDACIICTV